MTAKFVVSSAIPTKTNVHSQQSSAIAAQRAQRVASALIVLFLFVSGMIGRAQAQTDMQVNTVTNKVYVANYAGSDWTVMDGVKVMPTTNWPNPVDISYGAPLGGTQLNATFTELVNGTPVPIAGTATYTPPAGTLLGTGGSQALTVSFVPTDAANFRSISAIPVVVL